MGGMLAIKKILRSWGLDIIYYHPVFQTALKDASIDVVLDIGANTGQFAKDIHELVPQARIYSFEPLADVCAALKRNCDHLPGFEAFCFALGEKKESGIIERSEFSPSSSLLKMGAVHKKVFPYSAKTFQEHIEIKRLDDIAKNIDLAGNLLVKIDVQGFERAVIRGGLHTIAQAKVLLIETSFVTLYEDQPLFNDIAGLVQTLGFKYIGRREQHWDEASCQLLFEDSIFVKNV